VILLHLALQPSWGASAPRSRMTSVWHGIKALGQILLAQRRWLACWMAFLTLLIPGLPAHVHASQSTAENGRYFLVIDHSGSMLNPIMSGAERGRTRWDLMRERAAGFVERLPDGAEAWVIIFSAINPAAPDRAWYRIISARLDTPSDRERFSSLIRAYEEPGPANGTWLRQSIDKALEQVELAGSRNPDAYLTVMVYTDGVDEGHGRRGNPGSTITQQQLNERISRLKQRYRNFNLLNVYKPGDESIRDAHVVRLGTNRLQLANPRVLKSQKFSLDFAFRDTPALELSGRPLRLTLERADGAPLPLRLLGGPFRMMSGKLDLEAELFGEWPAGGDVRALLRVGYPEVDGSFLVTEGGTTVDLLIQGAEAPTIRNLYPAGGSVHPAGREILFSLTTLADAEVEWNFGEGQSAKGSAVRQTFASPGMRSVTVTVSDPRTGLSTSETFALEVERFGLKLDSPPSPLLVDQKYTFTAAAEGELHHYQWEVNGEVFNGVPRNDGVAGSALEISFSRPGPVRLSVSGEARSGARAESSVITLNINPVPALRVTSPASGDSLYFGSSRELRAEVEGSKAQRVRFTILSATGEPVVPPREVDVAQQGPLRVAVLTQIIPMLKGRQSAVLRVETLDEKPALVRHVEVVLERQITTLEVFLPDGPEPYIHRSTPLRARSNGVITDLQWDFGDGVGFVSGSEVERHVWTSYGDFKVRAKALDADGTVVESSDVHVKLPVRPVSIQPLLIHEGKVVGRDTDRVPVKATLLKDNGASGDVLKVRWYLDGVELDAGQETFVTESRGLRRVRVVAEGTPEAGSAEAQIDFRVSEPMFFWLIAAVLLALLALFGRLLLGNQWRFAEFQVRTDGVRWRERDSDGEVVPDADERRLGRGSSETLCGRWNPLTKRAIVRIASLDNRIETQLVNTGYRHCSFAWKPDDCFVFTGVDKSPVLRGSLAVRGAHMSANQASRHTLNSGDPKASDWLACWLLDRPGLPSRRPEGIPPGPSFETMAIFVRLRRKGGGWMYWHESAFVFLSLVILAAIGYAYTILY
jgi:hypothetical protein